MSSTQDVFYPVAFLSHLLGLHPVLSTCKWVRVLSHAYSLSMLSGLSSLAIVVMKDTLQPNSTIVQYRNLVMEMCALIFSILLLLTILGVIYCNFFHTGQFIMLLQDLDSVVEELKFKKIYIQQLKNEMRKVYLKYAIVAIAMVIEVIVSYHYGIASPLFIGFLVSSISFVNLLEIKISLVCSAKRIIFRGMNGSIKKMTSGEIPTRLESLQNLRSNHATLSSAIERSNSLFAPVLVFSTPLSFFNQIYGYYYLCIGLFDLEETFSDKRIGMLAGALLWLVTVTVPMVNLLWGCDCTVSEASATENLLLKMGFARECRYLSQQLYWFREELFHFRHVHYSVYGIVRLDRSTLFMISGATVVYLSTIIQFHLLRAAVNIE